MDELNQAIFNINYEQVENLIKSGADLNQANSMGMFPIESAINSDSPQMLDFIIKKGAQVNLSLRQGCTPLHIAVDYAMDGMVQDNTQTPNAYIIEMIKILLENGADLESRDLIEENPLDAINTYITDPQLFDKVKDSLRPLINDIDSRIVFKLKRK